MIFCLDEISIFHNYEYDEDSGDWVAGKLSKLKATVHEKSKLACSFGLGHLRLYFQEQSGQLRQAILDHDGEWNTTSTTAIAKPIIGTSLAAVASDDKLSVFYAHTPTNDESSIHRLIYHNSQWTGKFILHTAPGEHF